MDIIELEEKDYIGISTDNLKMDKTPINASVLNLDSDDSGDSGDSEEDGDLPIGMKSLLDGWMNKLEKKLEEQSKITRKKYLEKLNNSVSKFIKSHKSKKSKKLEKLGQTIN